MEIESSIIDVFEAQAENFDWNFIGEWRAHVAWP